MNLSVREGLMRMRLCGYVYVYRHVYLCICARLGIGCAKCRVSDVLCVHVRQVFIVLKNGGHDPLSFVFNTVQPKPKSWGKKRECVCVCVYGV